jgi:hypothetical protein
MEYQQTVTIKEYKGWLVLTLLNNGPKIKGVGTGILFSNFNKWDLYISDKALSIITDNLNKNLDKKEPVLEIIAMDRLWWASKQGIIIPPNEIYHIYTIPLFTKCDNEVDEKIKITIDKTC